MASIGNAEKLEEPEVWCVERLGEDAVAIRLVVKTEPGGRPFVSSASV